MMVDIQSLEKHLLDTKQIESLCGINPLAYHGDILQDMLDGKFGEEAKKRAELNEQVEQIFRDAHEKEGSKTQIES